MDAFDRHPFCVCSTHDFCHKRDLCYNFWRRGVVADCRDTNSDFNSRGCIYSEPDQDSNDCKYTDIYPDNNRIRDSAIFGHTDFDTFEHAYINHNVYFHSCPDDKPFVERYVYADANHCIYSNPDADNSACIYGFIDRNSYTK